jgi:hypothetical protein
MKKPALALACAVLLASILVAGGAAAPLSKVSASVVPGGLVDCNSTSGKNYVSGIWVTVRGGTSGWAYWAAPGTAPYTINTKFTDANWHYGPAYGHYYALTVGCGGSKSVWGSSNYATAFVSWTTSYWNCYVEGDPPFLGHSCYANP